MIFQITAEWWEGTSLGKSTPRGDILLLLLLLSCFSRVWFCATPWTTPWTTHQVPRPWNSPGKNTGVGGHFLLQCVKVKSESEVTQLCPTLSDPMDCSPPGSSVHGIFQARVLEWGAIAFSGRYLRIGQNHSTFWAKCVLAFLKYEIQVHRCQETEQSKGF